MLTTESSEQLSDFISVMPFLPLQDICSEKIGFVVHPPKHDILLLFWLHEMLHVIRTNYYIIILLLNKVGQFPQF